MPEAVYSEPDSTGEHSMGSLAGQVALMTGAGQRFQ
jgi:hypothetical protein